MDLEHWAYQMGINTLEASKMVLCMGMEHTRDRGNNPYKGNGLRG